RRPGMAPGEPKDRPRHGRPLPYALTQQQSGELRDRLDVVREWIVGLQSVEKFHHEQRSGAHLESAAIGRVNKRHRPVLEPVRGIMDVTVPNSDSPRMTPVDLPSGLEPHVAGNVAQTLLDPWPIEIDVVVAWSDGHHSPRPLEVPNRQENVAMPSKDDVQLVERLLF